MPEKGGAVNTSSDLAISSKLVVFPAHGPKLYACALPHLSRTGDLAA
jgi:hypothetical protein